MMNKTKYIEAIEKVELYAFIQDVIDRLRDFELVEAVKSPEIAITWMAQIAEIKERAMKIDGMKENLLSQAVSELLEPLQD